MKKRMTEKAIRKYQSYLYAEEKSSRTIEKYIQDVYKLYHFIGNKKQLDKETVLAFKAYLLTSYKAASVNSILAAVNGFFKYQQWPALHIKTVKAQRRVFAAEERELTKGEYIRLLNAAREDKNERLYLVMLTLCSTGMRIGELSYITAETVLAGQVSVRCKNKFRTVLFPKMLRNRLLAYMKKSGIRTGMIFITRTGRAMDRSNIWRQMKAVGEKAGLDNRKVYPHNLRHLFARTYYEKQKDVVKLADILGHSNIETTRIYTMSTGAEHSRQLGLLGLIV